MLTPRWSVLTWVFVAAAVVACRTAAADERPDRCFTLPHDWSFDSDAVAIHSTVSGTGLQLPSDGFVAVIRGIPRGEAGTTASGVESIGVAAIRCGSDGTSRIAWTTWLGSASTDLSLAGGWDATGDGDRDLLVCVSPRENYRFAAGTLLVLSCSDGEVSRTVPVATAGLRLGTGIAEIGGAEASSGRFLIAATDGSAPAKLIDFDLASGLIRDNPLVVEGADLIFWGLTALGQPGSHAEPSIAVRVRDPEPMPHFLGPSRVVAIDSRAPNQRTLHTGGLELSMCRAVPLAGYSDDDLMLAQIGEDVESDCVWLELRRTSIATGDVVLSRQFSLNDELTPGEWVMGPHFAATIHDWDDLDGDGTRDYVCEVACTCEHKFWKVLLVSGATGELLGRIDDALLARLLGPGFPRYIAPHIIVPLRTGPTETPAIGLACSRSSEGFDPASFFAALEVSECLTGQ